MNEPSFIERDLDAVKSRLMAGSEITPLDPEYVVLEQIATEMYLLRCNVQDACVKNLLQFSSYPVIDYLGALKEAPRNEGETTEAYAERLKAVMDSYAVAGPEDAYRYLVKQVDDRIIDVGTHSPLNGESPSGVMKIYVHTADYWTAELLAEELALPDEDKTLVEGVLLQNIMQSLLDAVLNALSDKKVRPLTEKVYVYFPSRLTKDYTVTIVAKKEVEFDLTSLEADLNTAKDVYALRLKNSLGVDAVCSQISNEIRLKTNEDGTKTAIKGVYSAIVEPNDDLPADYGEFIDANITINIAGIVDEK